MKRVIRLLIVIALCYFVLPASAQGKGDGLRKQAQKSLADKDYTRARYMFLQAYNAYVDAAQYDQAVACGVQASALYHRENLYNEAFKLLYGVEQNLIDGERKAGRQMPALRYPITRERLQMYIKLRKSASAKDQLAKLKGWAEAAKVDSLDTDGQLLLHLRTEPAGGCRLQRPGAALCPTEGLRQGPRLLQGDDKHGPPFGKRDARGPRIRQVYGLE